MRQTRVKSTSFFQKTLQGLHLLINTTNWKVKNDLEIVNSFDVMHGRRQIKFRGCKKTWFEKLPNFSPHFPYEYGITQEYIHHMIFLFYRGCNCTTLDPPGYAHDVMTFGCVGRSGKSNNKNKTQIDQINFILSKWRKFALLYIHIYIYICI